jgi:hypothetical protein
MHLRCELCEREMDMNAGCVYVRSGTDEETQWISTCRSDGLCILW